MEVEIWKGQIREGQTRECVIWKVGIPCLPIQEMEARVDTVRPETTKTEKNCMFTEKEECEGVEGTW